MLGGGQLRRLQLTVAGDQLVALALRRLEPARGLVVVGQRGQPVLDGVQLLAQRRLGVVQLGQRLPQLGGPLDAVEQVPRAPRPPRRPRVAEQFAGREPAGDAGLDDGDLALPVGDLPLGLLDLAAVPVLGRAQHLLVLQLAVEPGERRDGVEDAVRRKVVQRLGQQVRRLAGAHRRRQERHAARVLPEQHPRQLAGVEVGAAVAARQLRPQLVDPRGPLGLRRAVRNVQPAGPAQVEVGRLAVDAQPDGDGVVLRRAAGRAEDADDVAAVDVGPAALLRGQLGGEQQLGRTGGAAGQLPLLVGVQQAQRGDERRFPGAVGVLRPLPGDGDQPLPDHRDRVRGQPGDVDDLDADEHPLADDVEGARCGSAHVSSFLSVVLSSAGTAGAGVVAGRRARMAAASGLSGAAARISSCSSRSRAALVSRCSAGPGR